MDLLTIRKDKIGDFVRGLQAEAEVIAPVRRGQGEVALSSITSPEEIVWDYVNSLLPPKRFLLPQTEVLFRYRREGGSYRLEPVYDTQKRVLFGLRPCDVKAIAHLDKVFSMEPPDIYYLTRRENATLISHTCQNPGERCFCICADGGPFIEEGFDLQLTDLGAYFLVEIGSEKGGKLVERFGELFALASEADMEARKRLEAQATQRFKEPKAYFAQAIRRITSEDVPEEVWQDLGDRCLACGGCSYICPTCFCFNIVDRDFDGTGERIRTWDSCAYAGFTRMAGGYNPRKEKQDRRNRRFYHKLSYYYIQKYGAHGCVGCGRCITICMAAIDMPVVVSKIKASRRSQEATATR